MSVSKLKALDEVTVGTSPVQIFAPPYADLIQSVEFYADNNNTNNIWIADSSVSASPEKGKKLIPGVSWGFAGDGGKAGGTSLVDVKEIYAVSDAVGQKLHVVYLAKQG